MLLICISFIGLQTQSFDDESSCSSRSSSTCGILAEQPMLKQARENISLNVFSLMPPLMLSGQQSRLFSQSGSLVTSEPLNPSGPLIPSKPLIPSGTLFSSESMIPSGLMVPSGTIVPSRPMVNKRQMVPSRPMVPSRHMVPSRPKVPFGPIAPSGTLLPSGSLISSWSPLWTDTLIQSRLKAQNIFEQMPQLIPIQGREIHKSQFNLNCQTQSKKIQLRGIKRSVISPNNQCPSVIKDPKAENTNNKTQNNQNEEDIEEFMDIDSDTQVNTNYYVSLEIKQIKIFYLSNFV